MFLWRKHLILLQNMQLVPEFLLVSNARSTFLNKKKRREKKMRKKEAWKAERERKKKEGEEGAKKKAEQVAKKKEETVRRKEEAAKRKEEAAKKRAEKSLSKRRASVARSSAAKRSNNVDPDDGILQSESKTIESDVEGARAKGGSEIVSADFDENQCCIFFKTYKEDVLEETELSWLQCVRKRWVHEDCVTEVVMDKNGRELFLPVLCAIKVTIWLSLPSVFLCFFHVHNVKICNSLAMR